MVTQYISQRQKVFNRIVPILKSKILDVDKNFFISSMALELSCKKSLIEEAIDHAINAGLIRQEGLSIKSNLSPEEMLKSDGEREVEAEFKKTIFKDGNT
jgi:hypothetical protein